VDEVMTVREVARFLKLHPATVYRLLKTNRLPGFKLGSDWRVSRQVIEAWMKKNSVRRKL
jgi:excisionase family DNA binding protein